MMSDSDSDYRDVGTDDFENVTNVGGKQDNAKNKKTNANGRKVRGKDINWMTIKKFENVEDYENSDLFPKLKSDFTLQRSRDPEYADTETYICKFSRKVGYLPCPLKYKIDFLSNSDDVVATSNDTLEQHFHDVDPDDLNSGSSFKWTTAQTDLIKWCLENDNNPTSVLRNLENAQLLEDGNFPSKQQLNNKIQHCRKLINKTKQIFTTHDLREKIKEKLEVPEDADEAYIAYHEVLDENEDEEPRFTIIWTSKNLLKRTSSQLTQDDATYRLVWQGFPFFVSGVSSPTGKFHPTHCTLSSHEDTYAWSASYRFLRDVAKKTPKFRMGDGAPEITKAGTEVKIMLLESNINIIRNESNMKMFNNFQN
jgi:hypothetical protein